MENEKGVKRTDLTQSVPPRSGLVQRWAEGPSKSHQRFARSVSSRLLASADGYCGCFVASRAAYTNSTATATIITATTISMVKAPSVARSLSRCVCAGRKFHMRRRRFNYISHDQCPARHSVVPKQPADQANIGHDYDTEPKLKVCNFLFQYVKLRHFTGRSKTSQLL